MTTPVNNNRGLHLPFLCSVYSIVMSKKPRSSVTSINQNIEVNLTGIVGREGLWYSRYPAKVLKIDDNSTQVYIQLVGLQGKASKLWVECSCVFPPRNATKGIRWKQGNNVHVLWSDDSVGGKQRVSIWYEATIKQYRASDNCYLVTWTFDSSEEWVENMHIRSGKERPWETCKKEGKKRLKPSVSKKRAREPSLAG